MSRGQSRVVTGLDSRLIMVIVIVSRLRLASNDDEAGHWQPDKMGDYLVNGTTNGRVFYR